MQGVLHNAGLLHEFVMRHENKQQVMPYSAGMHAGCDYAIERRLPASATN